MYVRREALFSSQIEGTQATLDDILDPTIDRNANRDVTEVIDNVEAIFFAVEQMKDSNPKAPAVHETLARNASGATYP